MMSKHRNLYRLGLLILIGTGLYMTAWVIVDVLTLTRLWPRDAGFDAYGFRQSLTLWNDISFYTAYLTNLAALVFYLRRSALALPIYLVSLFAGLMDWVGLTSNAFFDGGMDAFFLFTIQAIGAVVIVLLIHRRVITSRLPPDSLLGQFLKLFGA